MRYARAGDTRPRIGLALGGGGARGVAHISVLKELEALHIPVDCIAGTSMGALVGGLYASGRSTQDMEKLILSTDWKQLFDDNVAREERSYRRKHDDRDGLATVGVGISGGRVRVSPGLLQGERILSMFERETLGVSEIDDFDKLPIPFRAVGTDLNTGQPVVLASGSLPMAMRASMSLPGIFQPMQIDGTVLIDGGVANQVPIDVVRAMGADIVIAVDVGTPLETLDRNASLLQVVSQMSGMLTVGNTAAHARHARRWRRPDRAQARLGRENRRLREGRACAGDRRGRRGRCAPATRASVRRARCLRRMEATPARGRDSAAGDRVRQTRQRDAVLRRVPAVADWTSKSASRSTRSAWKTS